MCEEEFNKGSFRESPPEDLVVEEEEEELLLLLLLLLLAVVMAAETSPPPPPAMVGSRGSRGGSRWVRDLPLSENPPLVSFRYRRHCL